LLGPDRFRFLNEMHDVSTCGWDDPAIGKLWRYNLHYFDDLNAYDAGERQQWHRQMLSRWVKDNRAGHGTGWEPYPTSLRIVNWIKCALAGRALPVQCVESLAMQTRWLSGRLETHLLGNHLLANAKALVFAGVFFRGREADEWFTEGMRILEEQITEQILSDGGHFERSPMYHSLVLEDLLDVINLASAFPDLFARRWRDTQSIYRETAHRMREWLLAMCHPDGEISFFNDAAVGIAPCPSEIEAYASRLGLPAVKSPSQGVTQLWDSGYVRLQSANAIVLLDVAPVGADYIPGHAHADTLSFELSAFGERVVVNSGTSCYGLGQERLRQRGTAAHNTITIDGRDSSEVWDGFRVGRRARPFGLSVEKDESQIKIRCAHDGYVRRRRKQIHWREWTMSDSHLCVVDHITGAFQNAVNRMHFSPRLGSAFDKCNSPQIGDIDLPQGRSLSWTVEGAAASLEVTTYHPEFGVTQPNRCLHMRLLEPRSFVRLSWK
jgi:uncharacterized heparinase superfamily protein